MALRQVLHLHALDLPGEDAGQRHHRVEQIVALFAEDSAFQVSALSWWHESAIAAALNADLLIVHDLAVPELAGILLARRAHRRASIFEIADDPTAVAPWRSRPRCSPLYLEELYYLAQLSDAVQVSSPGLAQRFAPLGKKITVLPNAVAFPAHLPEKAAGFRLGWAGTRSHREDLLPIIPVLQAFISKHANAVVALKGDVAMLRELFSAFPEQQIEIEPFGTYADYSRFLASLHVGLIPLGDSQFNRGRTAVKLVEMLAVGTLPIAQNCSIYRDYASHVPLFADAVELRTHLEQFYLERSLCQHRVYTARQALRASHDLQAVHARHRASYLAHVAAEGSPMPVSNMAADARYCQLLAVREARRSGQPRAAEALLGPLLAENPDFAQARWMLVQLLHERGACSAALEVAAPLQNCTVYGDLWLLLHAQLRPEQRQLLLPRFRSHRRQLMAIPLVQGDVLSQHRQRLAAHPFDFFALTVLARASGLPDAERQLIHERLALFPSSLFVNH